MKHDFGYYFMMSLMWFAAVLNIWMSWRSLRVIRTNREMREIIFAYEKDLSERGVTLPPRCVWCCQILPKHVDGCDFDVYYQQLGKLTEFLTRPKIKYYPKGEKPPELGGKRSA